MADIKEVPGAGTYENILEALAEYEASLKKVEQGLAPEMEDEEKPGSVLERIYEMPLSVSVRSGWQQRGVTDQPPEEYELLMGTGGPAVRIYGRLDQYGQPRSAELQGQDWFTPWERTTVDQDEEVLLKFAGYFYYD